MALTFNQVSGLTHPMLNSSVAENVYQSTPLLLHMKEKGSVMQRGGDYIKLPLTYAEISAAGSFQRYDILSTVANDTDTAARYDWKRYYAQAIVSQHELLQNSGEPAVADLLKSKVRNANLKLKKTIATDLYSTNGDSAVGIVGLRQLVKATGQVGNIDQSDFSGWASDIDSSNATLTLALMEQSKLDASVGNEEPDIIVTTVPVYKKYWDLLQANQRFEAESVGKGGFKYLLFDGIPIFWDRFCPGDAGSGNNHMFLLNSKWLYLFIHTDDNFKVKEMPDLANQDVHIDRVTVTMALGTDQRRLHSAFTVLNHT